MEEQKNFTASVPRPEVQLVSALPAGTGDNACPTLHRTSYRVIRATSIDHDNFKRHRLRTHRAYYFTQRFGFVHGWNDHRHVRLYFGVEGERVSHDSENAVAEKYSMLLSIGLTDFPLRNLQRRGLISYHRGQIAILNRKGLEKTARERYGIVRREFDRQLG